MTETANRQKPQEKEQEEAAAVVQAKPWAIVEIKGKQYRVEAGKMLRVDKMAEAPGTKLELSGVLQYYDGPTSRIGTPTLEDVKVKVEVIRHLRDKKITVFKYKPKKNYRRKTGHRQPYTELRVEEILSSSA